MGRKPQGYSDQFTPVAYHKVLMNSVVNKTWTGIQNVFCIPGYRSVGAGRSNLEELACMGISPHGNNYFTGLTVCMTIIRYQHMIFMQTSYCREAEIWSRNMAPGQKIW